MTTNHYKCITYSAPDYAALLRAGIIVQDKMLNRTLSNTSTYFVVCLESINSFQLRVTALLCHVT